MKVIPEMRGPHSILHNITILILNFMHNTFYLRDTEFAVCKILVL